MTKMNILGVVGARPNFMKIDPVFRALEAQPEKYTTYLVHTGQHYDQAMSKIFFEDLNMRFPDTNLDVGSQSHAQQTATIMQKLEPILLDKQPDLLVVVGDVNSTLAATLVASKLLIPIAHVEAGLRSDDRTMPEEINRLVTDALSDYLLTPSLDANENLKLEGIDESRIFFVGNVMIDTLNRCLDQAQSSPVFQTHRITRNDYALLTLHRPANVDDAAVLEGILTAIGEIQQQVDVVFPIHPRTKKQIEIFGLQPKVDAMKRLKLIPPLGYLDFLALEANAKLALTDSGGVQEETTALGVPCLTLRENTERPVTVTEGTNRIVGHDPTAVTRSAFEVLNGNISKGQLPKYWDGQAASRIVKVFDQIRRKGPGE